MSQRKSLSILLDAVIARSSLVSAVLIVVGTLGLVAVPLLERSISFDENALLAGSANPTIRTKSPNAYQLGKQFASSLHSSTFTPSFTRQLQQQLKQQLGLQVSNYTFTVSNYPSSSSSSSSGSSHRAADGQVQCTNVHTVLESRRGDGKEALALVTPINHQQFATDYDQDASGVQLALSLGFAVLHHLKTAAPWLAKDVIWVLPDASCGLVESMQAWTDAYQHPAELQASENATNHLAHFTRAGVLQHALVLELPTGRFNQLQISLEGYDGLLPKLDMYWLFRWYSWHYVAAPIELPHLGDIQQHLGPIADKLLDATLPDGGSKSPIGKAIQQHIFKFSTMVQFMWRQARGLPMGAHAPFKGLMVDAATLRVLRKDAKGSVVGPAGFAAVSNSRRPIVNRKDFKSNSAPRRALTFDEGLMQLGDVLELTLRSCSVLIERFHHSLFLYVLTGLDHYVSVERYIVPLVALVLVLVVQAAAIKPCGPVPTPSSTVSGSDPDSRAKTSKSAPPTPSQQQHQQQQQQQQQEVDGQPGVLSANHRSGEDELQLEDPLKLPPHTAAPAAAADRAEWVSAVTLVAAAHIVAIAAACALRQAPAIMLLLQQPQALSGWLTAAAAAPGDHLEQLGLGLGLLLTGVLACEGVTSGFAATCSRNSSRRGPNTSGTLEDQMRGSFVRKVLVVEFSIAAAALAAIACLNWAMGYIACLVLVPLAVGCAPPALNPVGTSTSSSSRWQAKCRSGVALVCCSPLCLLLLSAVMSDDGLQSVLHWLQWLVLQSSSGAYMFCWAIYMPFWCLLAWSMCVLGR